MKPIFPYYEVNGEEELRCVYETLWEISYLCKHCGLYRNGDCVCGISGFRRCRRGLSLYCEERTGRTYFGLKVKGHFNSSIYMPFGFGGLCLSEDTVQFLVRFQNVYIAGRDWLNDMSCDSGTYVNAIAKIRRIGHGVNWKREDQEIQVSENVVLEAVAALCDINATRNSAKIIQNTLCEYAKTHLLPKELERIRNIFEPYFKCADKLYACISKWLHDESQYRMGLTTLLNRIKDSKLMTAGVDDVHRIDAFCYAMRMLLKSTFSNNDETCEIGIHRIFQRYRYCFSTPDVRWRLFRKHDRAFTERLRVKWGFESVPLNILDNAVKYLPKDKIHRNVLIEFAALEGSITVTVKSYGPPRTDEELAHIWEQGDRGEQQKVEAYKVPGEGLGLSKVKSIVDDHGFKITATSKGKIIYSNGLPYREFAIKLEFPAMYVIQV